MTIVNGDTEIETFEAVKFQADNLESEMTGRMNRILNNARWVQGQYEKSSDGNIPRHWVICSGHGSSREDFGKEVDYEFFAVPVVRMDNETGRPRCFREVLWIYKESISSVSHFFAGGIEEQSMLENLFEKTKNGNRSIAHEDNVVYWDNMIDKLVFGTGVPRLRGIDLLNLITLIGYFDLLEVGENSSSHGWTVDHGVEFYEDAIKIKTY